MADSYQIGSRGGPGGSPDRPSSRRLVLRQALGGMMAWGAFPAVARTARAEGPAGPELIVRNMRPLDLETPVAGLDHWLTPNRLFFVRSHLSVPAVALTPRWAIEVGGLVDRPATLGLDDLAGLEQVTVPAVLQCSGNGRSNYNPAIPGVGWGRGAVGHAEWTGVRLADLLERAGIKAGAAHVQTLGADTPPSTKTPMYLRSLPIARALMKDTILATMMNGEPLPVLHGGPVRLVVPGWTGNHWMKWLRQLTVAREEAPGTYQQSGYKMPKVPTPPGVTPKPSDMVTLEWMNVKSLITAPAEGARLAAGRHEVRGFAWTGAGHVTRVEFANDRDPAWRPAALEGPERQGSWRRFRFAWDAREKGRHVLRVRAHDSNGNVQPAATAWNRSGYLWNGIDEVTCEIG